VPYNHYATLLDDSDEFDLPAGSPRNLYPPKEAVRFVRDRSFKGAIYRTDVDRWFSDIQSSFSVREEGIEPRKGEQMFDAPYRNDPQRSDQNTARVFRFWSLKRSLILFARWVGWLNSLDDGKVGTVLSYRPPAQPAADKDQIDH
jgi:hypothetical protein